MSVIKKIKEKLGEAKLKGAAVKSPRKKKFVNIAEAKTIGIIFDATSIDHLEILKKYVASLKEKKKIVKAVGFFDQKFTPVNISYSKAEFDFFNLKELTGLQQPSSPYIGTFINEPHDVLLDLNIQNKFPLRSIAIQSMARFKIGINIPENKEIHDLFLSLKPEEGLVKFLEQAEKYLDMIDKG
ncbi:MAG: hypothetical protein IAF38_22415 [Bacteroidia bacterium]|nr:hypothetical protein [Bacteroidia bacterium]